MSIREQLIILCWVICSSVVTAQNIDIGVRVNWFRNFDQTSVDERIQGIPADETQWRTRAYSADLFTEVAKTNNVFHRLRVGYQYASVSTYGERNTTTNETIIFDVEGFGGGYRIGLGIGKLHFLNEQLTLKYGSEVFLHINTDWHDDYTYDFFDSNDIKTQTIKIQYDEPGQKAGGIGFFMGFYYNFWKTFSLGMDISNYFQYAHKSGNVDINYEYYDANGILASTDVRKDEVKLNAFSSFFLSPSIGLAYRF